MVQRIVRLAYVAKRHPLVGMVVGSILLFSACGTTPSIPNNTNDMGSMSPTPDLSHLPPGATFQTVRTNVFTHCSGFPECHRQSPFAGGLDLTDANAYQALVRVPATIDSTKIRVVPGDSANSFLLMKLTDQLSPQDGNPMPQSEGLPWMELPANLIADVKSWIDSGAPNN